MFKLNLKIALRNLQKNFGVALISIGGLAIALAAFILIIIYVKHETSYDKTNPNYKNIYLVGRVAPAFTTNYTPPPLAKLIQQNCPEVELAGKLLPSGFEFSISSDKRKVYIKNSVVADYNAAKILGLNPEKGLIKPKGETERLFYLNKASMATLFPDKTNDAPELVSMGSKAAGQTATVSGIVIPNLHSNIVYDALAVANEIDTQLGFGYPNYYTFIQVKPETDIKNLTSKVNALIKQAKLKEGFSVANVNTETVFLDPLAKLHLQPTAGTDTNFKAVVSIFVLGILILVIAFINFTNLSIAQANKRAKEVGIKKVLGSYRHTLTLQFVFELFIQCLIATVLGLILAELFLPAFNNLFKVSLYIWQGDTNILWILPAVLAAITLIAGIYPALVLSGFKPAMVLKGNFNTSINSQWLRKGLLIFQFTIAAIFIAALTVVSAQIKYMHTEDPGFNANQVVSIKNMSYFSKTDQFEVLRDKMMKIEGIKSATVANIVPDGSSTGTNGYTIEGVDNSMEFIDVDFDYFETLDIKLKEGRFFSRDFKTDTANSAILNEAAVARYGLKNPIGKTVRGCDIDYKIVGVIKDFKSQGFENMVEPTIYSIKNPCGNSKTAIMLKIDQKHMAGALALLKKQWPEINKLDGEDFRYEFLDDLYGRLFQKQEQLQSIFFASAMLTIFIAILGLFAFARFMTNNRTKEIAVRKILGANNFQILRLLNSSFLWMILISNLLAWPIAYLITAKWLETFAYRIDISLFPFILAGSITVLLTFITVSVQAAKAVKANPVKALKYE